MLNMSTRITCSLAKHEFKEYSLPEAIPASMCGKTSTMREGSGYVYICQHAYNKNQSLLPLNHLSPHPSLGVAKRTVRLHLHRLHGLGARREREPPPGGQDGNLGLKGLKGLSNK